LLTLNFQPFEKEKSSLFEKNFDFPNAPIIRVASISS